MTSGLPEPTAAKSVPAKSGPAKSGPLSLPVKGMHCASCVGRVEKAIGGVPGVADVAVNLATEQATVSFLGPVNLEGVLDAINRAGYASVLSSAQFMIEKMHCDACVKTVEEAFREVEGVVETRVDLATGTGVVRFVSGATTPAAIARAATEAGYPARELRPEGAAAGADEHQHDHGDGGDLRRATLLALLLTLPVVALEMGSHVFPAVHMFVIERIGVETSRIIEFALTALVLFGPGWRFFRKRRPGASARRARDECAGRARLRRGFCLFDAGDLRARPVPRRNE